MTSRNTEHKKNTEKTISTIIWANIKARNLTTIKSPDQIGIHTSYTINKNIDKKLANKILNRDIDILRGTLSTMNKAEFKYRMSDKEKYTINEVWHKTIYNAETNYNSLKMIEGMDNNKLEELNNLIIENGKKSRKIMTSINGSSNNKANSPQNKTKWTKDINQIGEIKDNIEYLRDKTNEYNDDLGGDHNDINVHFDIAKSFLETKLDDLEIIFNDTEFINEISYFDTIPLIMSLSLGTFLTYKQYVNLEIYDIKEIKTHILFLNKRIKQIISLGYEPKSRQWHNKISLHTQKLTKIKMIYNQGVNQKEIKDDG